jgi:hypothetical protein
VDIIVSLLLAGLAETLLDVSNALNNNVIMPAGDHIVGVTYKQTVKTEEPDLLYLPALRR